MQSVAKLAADLAALFRWQKIVVDITRYTLFLSKDKVYKDIEAEILLKIKNILRTKPSLRFEEKWFMIYNLNCFYINS